VLAVATQALFITVALLTIFALSGASVRFGITPTVRAAILACSTIVSAKSAKELGFGEFIDSVNDVRQQGQSTNNGAKKRKNLHQDLSKSAGRKLCKEIAFYELFLVLCLLVDKIFWIQNMCKRRVSF